MTEPASDATVQGLRALRHTKPAWYWLQQNFSLPAVLTIVGISLAFGGWIVSLKTRVVVLEHDFHTVEHVITIMPDKASMARLDTRATELERRVGKLEDDWGFAAQHSADPPGSKKPPKKP